MMRSPVSSVPRNVMTNRELLLSEHGRIQVLVQELRPTVRVPRPKCDYFYRWNQVTKLWEKIIGDTPLLDFCRKYLYDIVHAAYAIERDEEALYQLENLLKQIETVKFIRSLWRDVKERLLDDAFESKLNKRWPQCLAIANGLLIDLRNLTTRERNSDDMCSFECPVNFTPHSPLLNASSFFSSLMCGDQDMLNVLQKICGYLLTGEKTSRCFFLFWGPQGSNGKSTLIELLRLVLGSPYFSVLSSDVTFSGRRAVSGSHTAHLMPLEHARVGVYSESKAADSLNDSIIKILTSETGSIPARAAYGREMIEIHSCARLLIETNHLISFDAKDQAMLDRLVAIPFLARFTKESGLRNVEFISKLKTVYLDEVFTWMAIGAARWYSSNPSFSCTKRMVEYRQELINLQDFIGYFIDSVLDVHQPNTGVRMPRSQVIDRFIKWCKEKHLVASEKDIKTLLALLPKNRKIRGKGAPPASEESFACSLKTASIVEALAEELELKVTLKEAK